MAETGLLAAFRVAARAVGEAQRATRRDFVLWPPRSPAPAPAPSPVSAATGETGQEDPT
jgi:hypothetical protein